MKQQKLLNRTRAQRKRRSRSSIFGTKEMPRLSVFKSNQRIYIQLIDDQDQKTLASAASKKGDAAEKKIEALCKEVSKKAKELKIESMICDRGQYRYHGVVKNIVEGLKKEGLHI